jgi:hypothetical protein
VVRGAFRRRNRGARLAIQRFNNHFGGNMRSFLIPFALVSLLSASGFAAESIVCQIEDGSAVAYFCKTSGGGSASGTFDIQILGKGSSRSDFCIGIAIAIDECKELCRVPASDDAVSCFATKRD